jgi:hypothetical protein
MRDEDEVLTEVDQLPRRMAFGLGAVIEPGDELKSLYPSSTPSCGALSSCWSSRILADIGGI